MKTIIFFVLLQLTVWIIELISQKNINKKYSFKKYFLQNNSQKMSVEENILITIQFFKFKRQNIIKKTKRQIISQLI